jgi:hypothetical protein
MLSLSKDNIIALFVWIDDNLPKTAKPQGGRPTILTDSELVTILLWNVFLGRHKTLKDIYRFTNTYHSDDFPRIPNYVGFVYHCHRAIPLLINLLKQLLHTQAPLRFMDSTMLEVCKLIRANSHRVAKDIASFGKNHQGWHYGFKLHASVDKRGRLCGIALTPANVFDAHLMPKILNKDTKVAVGDSHYGASVMRKKIFDAYGTLIIAPPHFKQRTKIMTSWQHLLLKARPKIESVFDYLKEHMHLVTSFPRSVSGYLLHYLRILVGYQLMTG